MALRSHCNMMLRSLGRLVPNKKPPCGSVVRALSRSMSREDFDSILLHCNDPRDILSVVAKVLEIPMPQVLEEVAKVMRLPCASVLPPLDLSSLETLLKGVTHAELQRSGCMPVVMDRQVEVIACVDPALVEDRLPALRTFPKVLVSWPTLRRALGTPELHGAREVPDKSIQRRHAAPLKIQAEQGLVALIGEIEKYGATELSLYFPEDSSIAVEYRFVAANKKHAKGVVSQGLSSALREWGGTIGAGTHVVNGTAWSMQLNSKKSLVLTKFTPVPSKPPALTADKTSLHASSVSWVEGSAAGNILIVEDQGIFAQVLSRYLSRQGMTCTRFEHGNQVLGYLQSGNPTPSAILSDVHMPGMGGEELLVALKSRPEWCSIPVLMLTSDTSAELEVQLVSLGAHACLRKHEDPRVIAAYVARFMRSASTSEGRDAA